MTTAHFSVVPEVQQKPQVARAACRQQPAAHKPCSSLPPQPGFAVWGSPAGQATQNNTINGISVRGSFNTVASALFKHFFSQCTLKPQNQRPDRGSTPSVAPVDTFLSTHDSTKRSPRRPSQRPPHACWSHACRLLTPVFPWGKAAAGSSQTLCLLPHPPLSATPSSAYVAARHQPRGHRSWPL